MAQLLPLSKAARLIGIKRGALQKKIQDGELSTFEGKISVTELLRTYPSTKIEDCTMLERVEKIKEEAVKHRQRQETDLPITESLRTRLAVLSKELVSVKSDYVKKSQFLEILIQKLNDTDNVNDANLRSKVVAIREWLILSEK